MAMTRAGRDEDDAEAGERAWIDAAREAFRSVGALGDPLDDDTAPLPAVAPGAVRVVTTDVAIEGIDFDRALYPLGAAGHRVLVQNLSDLAGAGAVPVGFVWSLAVPAATPRSAVVPFFDGAARAAARFGCPLFGGDLSATPGPLSCAVTAFGDVAGQPLRRDGARPGDDVWISRRTGASAAGLRLLRTGASPSGSPADVLAIAAHIDPTPALDVGAALVGVATSCIDVSDGLLLDLSRVADASRVALALDALEDAVDRAAGATVDEAMGGGEDWALAFTAPAGAAVPDGCIRIGRVVEGRGLLRDGQPLAPRGYDHFATRP